VLIERTDRALAPLGLTAQQVGVIVLLACGRAHTPYELSRAMSYDSGSMTRMIDRLEKKGFVPHAQRRRPAHGRFEAHAARAGKRRSSCRLSAQRC
jgi:DNA-binding MarR family transcriptional regulator